MPPEHELPVEIVSTAIIRQFFNTSQMYERTKTGDLVAVFKKDKHSSIPPRGEPFCTRSQIFYYTTLTGKLVAIVHQYLRPDGSLGASGLPDPKMIILEDRIIAVRAKPKPSNE
jgi:hypothetical protein